MSSPNRRYLYCAISPRAHRGLFGLRPALGRTKMCKGGFGSGMKKLHPASEGSSRLPRQAGLDGLSNSQADSEERLQTIKP